MGAAGMSENEILEAYRDLDAADVRQVAGGLGKGAAIPDTP